MRATITATQLLSTRGRIDVLRVLWKSRAPITAAEVSRRAGLTYPATSTVLDALLDLGVVDRSPAGRGHSHWLVRENEYVRTYVAPVFEGEEVLPDRLEEDLRDTLCAEWCLSLVLFGSYARGDQTIDSDVDVIAVCQSTEDKVRLERRLGTVDAGFRLRWGASLSLIAYDRDEAATLRERAPGLYASLNREGVTIAGLMPVEWEGLHAT